MLSLYYPTKYFVFTLSGSHLHLGVVILNNVDVRFKLTYTGCLDLGC